MISSRAVEDTRNTGRGPNGRSLQTVQARAAAEASASVSAIDRQPSVPQQAGKAVEGKIMPAAPGRLVMLTADRH